MKLTKLIARDPSNIGFPPTLPLELAAKTHSVKQLCEVYGISRDEWEELRINPLFQKSCEEAIKTVESAGGAFRAKTAVMAEALLARMYELATSNDFEAVPASVQADMIKTSIRVAGLDASIEQKGAAQGKALAQNPLMIQINLR